MLWTFGRCGYTDDQLAALMHSVAEKLVGSCDRCAQLLGGRTTLWVLSFAVAAHPCLPHPHKHSTRHQTHPTPHNRSATLAEVVAAEARMGWVDPCLAELVGDYAAAHIGAFDGAQLAELMASLASAG